MSLPACAKAPCKSCPYRRDVPSGVWAAEEYDKLRLYDGTTTEQAMKGATGLFLCHQHDGHICAGWAGCHDKEHLLALRFRPVDPSVYGYVSPIPLFASGAEAADHGMARIADPDERAFAIMERVVRRQPDLDYMDDLEVDHG